MQDADIIGADRMEEGITEGGGIDLVIPLVAAGLVAGGTALTSYYDISRAYEQRKYFDDYLRHTRVRSIKYPYRIGYNDIYKAYGNAIKGVGYSMGFGYNWYSRGYHPRGSRNYDIMYG